METKAEVRSFLENLLKAKHDEKPFSDTEPLITSGRLESMDVIEIVVFLEEAFKIDFAEYRFDQYDFDTLEGIVKLIDR